MNTIQFGGIWSFRALVAAIFFLPQTCTEQVEVTPMVANPTKKAQFIYNQYIH